MRPFDIASVRASLPAREIRWYDTVDSTMNLGARLAESGAAHGTVILAGEQTAGQGRYGRAWHSEPGAGVYMTALLRLGLPVESLPVVTLALGLATAEAIADVCSIPCDLRWPNDVLANGRKCAGILVQLHEGAIVAGIGINVNQSAFPMELQASATSLRLVTGREQSRERLLVRLLQCIDDICVTLQTYGREAVLRMFAESSSYVNGRRVTVEQGAHTVEGVTDGLDSSGFLILRRDDGRRQTILAGGVRPAV